VSSRVRPFSILIAFLLVCLFAATGFRVGQIIRPSTADAASTWQSAATTSYSRAKANAYRLAWQRAYASGWRAGVSAADAAGARAGRGAGEAEAAVQARAARALASVLAATPRKLPRRVKTEACVPVAGGLCEVLGPRVTGTACPPSSVAYPEGGAVCIPRVLLVLARAGA
jgi:hypothetical protein